MCFFFLEVLESYLVQHKALLTAIGRVDLLDTYLITFDLVRSMPRFSH
jgi:hypothetical protein